MNNIKNTRIGKFLFQNYILKAFTSFSLTQFLGTLVGLAMISLYTKNLFPSDFGKINFIMITVGILSIVIDSGLNTAFSIKFFKVPNEQNAKTVYSILIYNFFVVSIFYAIFLFIPSISKQSFRVSLTIPQLSLVFALILVTIIGRFYTNFLIISRQPKSYFWVNIYFFLALLLMSFLFLLILKMGYFAYIKAYFFAHTMLAVIGLYYFFSIYKPELKELFSFRRLSPLLKLGLPLVPNSILLMLLNYADRYMLEIYTGLSAVGIYSVGYTFAEKINSLVINPMGQALTPQGFQTFARSIPEYKEFLKKIFEGYWFIIEVLLVAYFSILREVFDFIVGKEYIEGFNIIAIVILGTVFGGGASMVAGTLMMKEKTDKVFMFSFVSVIFNVGLNLFLIPEFGIYGAALATFLSYVLYFEIFFIYTQKLVYVPYNFRKILLSGFFTLLFLGIILFLSYTSINLLLRLLIKLIFLLIFIIGMQKFFKIKDVIMEFLRYGIQR